MATSPKHEWRRLEGQLLSQAILKELRPRALALAPVLGRRPKFVLVGSFESESSPGRHHADLKRKACEAAEIDFEVFEVPWGESEWALVDVVNKLNAREDIDGLFIQTPFRYNVDFFHQELQVNPDKDVDAAAALNLSRLLLDGLARFDEKKHRGAPAAVAAVLEVLRRNDIAVKGERVIILGDEHSAAYPSVPYLSLAFSGEGALTLTVHIDQLAPESVQAAVSAASVVISTGLAKPSSVDPSWLKEGVVLVDMGQHIVPANTPRGYRVLGDFDDKCLQKCSAATPVPGCIGPMTVAMLLRAAIVNAEFTAETLKKS